MDLSATIHLLGDMLGQVISEQESLAAFDLEERVRLDAKARRAGDQESGARLGAVVSELTTDQARVVAAAFNLYFDLVNLAEENSRVQALRSQERASHPLPRKDSIGEAIRLLKDQGLTQEQMEQVLANLQIELVLTAHPTEAKRRTILSKLQRIAEILHAINQADALPAELENYQCLLHAEITNFWLTERARTDRPTVTDEVRTGLYFIEQIFWHVIPHIYQDLQHALAEHYPGTKVRQRWFSLASWIGGDRDGNPNVTVEVTAETLRLHRGLAVEKHRQSLQELARWLSISARRIPHPAHLQAWYEKRRPLPEHVAYLEKRYSREPYRLTLSLLAEDLAQASRDDMTARLLSQTPHSARVSLSDFSMPLEIIRQSIPPSVSGGLFDIVQRQFEVFGLHAARLDIREDSGRLNNALDEILRALDPDTACLGPQVDPAQRVGILVDFLEQPTPDLALSPGVTRPAAEIWALFKLIARTRQLYGQELFGSFIITMTHSEADMLAVLLMARWTGCEQGMMITPLFETIVDLQVAPEILERLFDLPVYRAHLHTCDDEQMVMIGYSDSNKDGGYLAANWALYQAQEEIARVCENHGVKLTLFHGRGGSVARGGGPANRAIRAQPPGTVGGHFRVTEQGEIIAARYANPFIAHRHLEQIVNAVLLASAPNAPSGLELQPAWRQAMDQMAERAQAVYRELVFNTPGFLDFWRAATPLDEIKRLQIGSRPAARQGGSDAVDKIRAIPWVFSWMQSRFNLAGWYGLGSGLEAYIGQLPLLQEMYARWPFFCALLDNAEMSLLKADLDIAALYVTLVPNQVQAQAIFTRLKAEFEKTRDLILMVSGHEKLMDNEPVVQRAVDLRNPYIDPLNYVQVEVLRRLRSLDDPEGPQAQELREVMVLTINGIAAGLRNTG